LGQQVLDHHRHDADPARAGITFERGGARPVRDAGAVAVGTSTARRASTFGRPVANALRGVSS
jgi:hypothetical protein